MKFQATEFGRRRVVEDVFDLELGDEEREIFERRDFVQEREKFFVCWFCGCAPDGRQLAAGEQLATVSVCTSMPRKMLGWQYGVAYPR